MSEGNGNGQNKIIFALIGLLSAGGIGGSLFHQSTVGGLKGGLEGERVTGRLCTEELYIVVRERRKFSLLAATCWERCGMEPEDVEELRKLDKIPGATHTPEPEELARR